MKVNAEFKPHWWSKTLIGVFLGLLLAYGFVANFAWFGPHGIEGQDKVQFNMWIVSPLWLTFLSLVYLFSNRRNAFVYFCGANGVVYSVYFLLWSLQ
ncbi:hypothetical protein PULV_b0144 [Pseudoalteromonas ulvae UL12]|uniref:Uncharacterized protein n=1 Tax=Pseudoalteromonas ulvae TaxID=107327 RepID=A0A244CQS6_PSEDV|nr:hypothetical protein [Pseudoalteromonas ulvae]MBE0365551.1 hypothetical protein [Pseudoalteromonas ulvae UL12]OUL57971.1 hypothetical protein B1199_06295 [Pseudoalteromonas ulvae]